MSGSPKTLDVWLRNIVEERLGAERRQRAEAERGHRTRAEDRARVALALALSQTLEDEARRLRADLQTLRAELAASGVPGAVPHVEDEIDAAVALAGTTPERVAASLGTVRALCRSVALLRASLGGSIDGLADEQGVIQREAATHAARLASAARSEDARLHELAARSICELHARVAGLEADEVAMAWVADEVRAVAAAIESLRDSTHPEAGALALEAQLDAALERAQARQLVEERRAYIVEALQDGLRAQGFHVGVSVLVGEGLDGEVAFIADRADDRHLAVKVPLTGRVTYLVDAADTVHEPAPDGASFTTCDGTEERLESLHADLASRFGVESGELHWATKPPRRTGRTAKALPSEVSATRRRG